jgi:hypothetical protein
MGHNVEMISKEASQVYLLKVTREISVLVGSVLVEEVVDISVGYGTPLSHSSI